MSKKIAGVDEAGRGPLAGPVVAAAVIWPEAKNIKNIVDSKKLTDVKRRQMSDLIKAEANSYAIAEASVEEIDKLNILQASLLAMKRAIMALDIKPDECWIDGTFSPIMPNDYSSVAMTTFVKGDSLHAEISAASILAKVSRDEQLIAMDALYPEYGFAKHKGYPTAMHKEALKKYGVLSVHRQSFKPVLDCLNLV